MAFNEKLAEDIRKQLKGIKGVLEKKMFGGLCFLYQGNMAVGIAGEDLMVRVGPKRYDAALKLSHARVMDFTGRPLTGFIFVGPPGTKTAASLKKWLALGLDFARSLPAK